MHLSVIKLNSDRVVGVVVHGPNKACEIQAQVLAVPSPRCCAWLESLVDLRLPRCSSASFEGVQVEIAQMSITSFPVSVCVASFGVVIFDPVIFVVIDLS